MSFKVVLLIASGLVLVGAGAYTVYSLRQAAAEATRNREALKNESDCDALVPLATKLVTSRNSDRTRVTGTASHFNNLVQQCYVEVDTYEHGETPVYSKTLISPAEKGAVLWTVAGRPDNPDRRCFGADSMLLDCTEADKRWKTFMTQ